MIWIEDQIKCCGTLEKQYIVWIELKYLKYYNKKKEKKRNSWYENDIFIFNYSYFSTALGNENIHKIVAGTNHSMRVDIENIDTGMYFADYHTFKVSDESSNYTLIIVDQSGKDGKCIVFVEY